MHRYVPLIGAFALGVGITLAVQVVSGNAPPGTTPLFSGAETGSGVAGSRIAGPDGALADQGRDEGSAVPQSVSEARREAEALRGRLEEMESSAQERRQRWAERRERWMTAGLERAQREGEFQIELLAFRFGLSAAQQQKLKGLLNARLEKLEASFGAEGGGGDPRGMFRQLQQEAEAELRANLTPQQQAAYDEYRKQETGLRAEREAFDRSSRMQVMLGLDDQQTDQVFQIIASSGEGWEPSMSRGEGITPEQAQAQFAQAVDRRVQQVASVLTPAQQAVYRKYLESRQGWRGR